LKFYNFNFLPYSEREKRAKKSFIFKLFLDCISALIIIFLYFFFFLKSSFFSLHIKDKKEKVKKLDFQILSLKRKEKKINQKIKSLKKEIKLIQNQKIPENINIEILNIVEKFLPERLSLSYLKLDIKKLKIKGYADSPKNIFKYLNSLKTLYKLVGFKIKPSKKIFKFEAEFILNKQSKTF